MDEALARALDRFLATPVPADGNKNQKGTSVKLVLEEDGSVTEETVPESDFWDNVRLRRAIGLGSESIIEKQRRQHPYDPTQGSWTCVCDHTQRESGDVTAYVKSKGWWLCTRRTWVLNSPEHDCESCGCFGTCLLEGWPVKTRS